MASTRVLDGDGHILESQQEIAKFLPDPYKDVASVARMPILFPYLDHLRDGQAPCLIPPGSFRKVDAAGWGEFMDDVHIDAAVVYPTSGLGVGRINNLSWARAITHAYNDYLHTCFLEPNPRLKGMGLLPMQDPEAAVHELRRAVLDLGMCGGVLPSNGLPEHLGSKVYWPVYEEAQRLGCCLAVHGGCHGDFGFDDLNVWAAVHAIGHPHGMVIGLTAMLFNGIFDKFPGLKVGFLEGGVAWFLMVMERASRSGEAFRPFDPEGDLMAIGPDESIEEYIRRHLKAGRIFIGVEGDEPALTFAVNHVGNEPFIFSSDFPHEVNNDLIREEIKELRETEEITQADKDAILYKNAERFYGLTGNGAAA